MQQTINEITYEIETAQDRQRLERLLRVGRVGIAWAMFGTTDSLPANVRVPASPVRPVKKEK